MELLDATPLRGPGCDRTGRASVRGLIGAFRLPSKSRARARALTWRAGADATRGRPLEASDG
jgi:hypothetical protein